MNRQTLGVVGSIVLLIGVFTPVVSLPVVGQQNLFQNGRGDGMFLLLLALVAMLATFAKRFRWVLVTGVLALAFIAFNFWLMQSRISSMRAELERDLAGNPFRGLGDMMLQAVQIQWGWIVLAAGGILLVIAGASRRTSAVTGFGADGVVTADDEPAKLSPAMIAVLVLLALAGGGYFVAMQRQRAEEARQAAAAREEAERQRRAEEEAERAEEAAKEAAVSQLALKDWNWDQSGYSSAIAGTVVNESNRHLSMVRIEFSIMDRQGNLLGTTSDYVSSLTPGERWRFRCLVTQDGRLTARLRDLTARAD